HVVTSRLDYTDPGTVYPAREVHHGVTIHRLWSTRFGRRSLAGRLLDYLSIYLSFFAFLLRHPRAADTVVVKTDPPLLSVPGAVAQALVGFRMVAWCQDLFPEVAVAVLHPGRIGRGFLSLVAELRDASLRAAECVVVLGSDMEAFLRARGLPGHALAAIPNWSVQDERGPAEPTPEALRAEWGIAPEALVIGYSGNLGRAHDWETLLGAARLLGHAEDLRFLVCGGGHGYARLEAAVREAGLAERFVFQPYQPIERLAASLQVPDLHWFSLMEAMTPFIFPSKFAGILQAGRPVLFIGATGSGLARRIREERLGGVVAPGQSTALAAIIEGYRGDRPALADAGARARRVWEGHYRKAVGVARWETLLGTGSCINGFQSTPESSKDRDY
ncbi:MAG: glycosyltransferase family 4 protein, partial [Oceanipulchritudo sp.]